MEQEKLTQAASKFIGVNNLEIAPLGAGHINDSYRVRSSDGEYVMQRINHNIFKNVDQLMNNIARVTRHVRIKLVEKGVTDYKRRVLNLIPTKDSRFYYRDEEGNCWRMMDYVKDSYSFDSITPALAEKAGAAFGEFQDMLADLPGGPLFETIPNFHNMETRLDAFRKSVASNAAGRLDEVKDLVNEIEKRAEEMCLPERLHRRGELPKRTNHCDTKVNNILFDDKGEVLCVVDLDTVMPGYVLSDFGDFMRTGANNGAEDDTDLSRVSINLPIFEAYTKGYLRKASGFLTELEKELLPFGAKLLTYMQTVRFLTDYIDGDTYYKIKSPKHNLERSLAQFKLLQSMEENFEAMVAIAR